MVGGGVRCPERAVVFQVKLCFVLFCFFFSIGEYQRVFERTPEGWISGINTVTITFKQKGRGGWC